MAEQWATSSNSALRIKLLDSDHLYDEATFHPTFTYPIYGEAETIYGYSNLQIELGLKSDSLLSALTIKHDAKLESKTAKVDDPKAALMEFLPKEDVCESLDELEQLSASKPAFKPLGKKIHTYTRITKPSNGKGKGKAQDRTIIGRSSSNVGEGAAAAAAAGQAVRTFEVYHCDWNTPGFREYHRRMQLFTLLFIEGASYIDEGEKNWEFLVVYEVTPATSQYHFVGYTSLYNFWFYPSWHRLRLSQFVILPPFQMQGHGSELYGQVVKLAKEREDIVELTIEDPSEAFDRLRDTNDLKRLLSPEDGFLLRAKEHVKGGALRAPLDKKWSESERLRHKIAKRQWDRLVEMCMLMMLDEQDDEQITKFRLQVKARVFAFNRDVLQQMEHEERIAKLQETFESVMDEYGQLTGVDVDAIIESGLEPEHQNGSGPAAKVARLY